MVPGDRHPYRLSGPGSSGTILAIPPEENEEKKKRKRASTKQQVINITNHNYHHFNGPAIDHNVSLQRSSTASSNNSSNNNNNSSSSQMFITPKDSNSTSCTADNIPPSTCNMINTRTGGNWNTLVKLPVVGGGALLHTPLFQHPNMNRHPGNLGNLGQPGHPVVVGGTSRSLLHYQQYQQLQLQQHLQHLQQQKRTDAVATIQLAQLQKIQRLQNMQYRLNQQLAHVKNQQQKQRTILSVRSKVFSEEMKQQLKQQQQQSRNESSVPAQQMNSMNATSSINASINMHLPQQIHPSLQHHQAQQQTYQQMYNMKVMNNNTHVKKTNNKRQRTAGSNNNMITTPLNGGGIQMQSLQGMLLQQQQQQQQQQRNTNNMLLAPWTNSSIAGQYAMFPNPDHMYTTNASNGNGGVPTNLAANLATVQAAHARATYQHQQMVAQVPRVMHPNVMHNPPSLLSATSNYRGVIKKNDHSYIATFRKNILGQYSDSVQAARAYDTAFAQIYGVDPAMMNFPLEWNLSTHKRIEQSQPLKYANDPNDKKKARTAISSNTGRPRSFKSGGRYSASSNVGMSSSIGNHLLGAVAYGKSGLVLEYHNGQHNNGLHDFMERREFDYVEEKKKPFSTLHGKSLPSSFHSTANTIGSYSPLARKEMIRRFMQKRKKRIWVKRIKYDVRKRFADLRLRYKGRFITKQDEELLRAAMDVS